MFQRFGSRLDRILVPQPLICPGLSFQRQNSERRLGVHLDTCKDRPLLFHGDGFAPKGIFCELTLNQHLACSLNVHRENCPHTAQRE
jgi:hypothetical protein